MDQFVSNFQEFRDFLNSSATEHLLQSLAGDQAATTLKIIRDKFDELGLNEAF